MRRREFLKNTTLGICASLLPVKLAEPSRFWRNEVFEAASGAITTEMLNDTCFRIMKADSYKARYEYFAEVMYQWPNQAGILTGLSTD